jgi:hypothetical protein
VTRFFAAARTLWDWDEAQFSMALREYDVALHHPHPPGFPVYVAAGRFVHLFVPDEFHALQVVVVLSACALFPLALAFAREAGFNFRTSYLGALLFVFLPTVWFYGGTAFSDVPGVAIVLAACTLLLRGRTDARAYYAGAVVLALAVGVRPQALLFGCVPALVATWQQWQVSRVRVLIACAIGALGVAAIYVGAAAASASFDAYMGQLAYVRQWVRTTDAYTNPNRAPVVQLLDEFLVKPMRGGRLGLVVAALAGLALVVSLFRHDRPTWLVFGTFFPFAFFALFMLDINSYARYGVSYIALHALLAARGGEWLTAGLRRLRVSSAAVHTLLMFAIVVRYAWWTYPAIAEVHRNPSPPAALVTWLRTNVPGTLWVHGGMRPVLQWGLPDRDLRIITGMEAIPPDAPLAGAWYISEGLSNEPTAVEFRRAHSRVWEIARQRYFESYAVPLLRVWRFGDGWYGEEAEGEQVTRWMRARSLTYVPADGRPSRLALEVISPAEIRPPQTVEVRWNGAVVDRFTSPGTLVQWSRMVPTKNGTNVLELRASGTATTPADPREFGVRLFSYSLTSGQP